MFPYALSALGNTVMHIKKHKKRGNGLFECFHGFPGNPKIKGDKKGKHGWWKGWYLSRTNSAISFCICFPFSCFCSKTSNPVTQPLLWVSFLSVYEIKDRTHTRNVLNKLLAANKNVTPPTMFFLSVMKKIGNHNVRLQYFYVNKFCWLSCPLPTATPCSQCAFATVRTATARRPNTPAWLQATLQGWKRPNRAAEDSWLTALQSVPRIVSFHCAV